MTEDAPRPPRPRLVVSNRSRRIVESLSQAQIQKLHRMFQGEWWTRGRSLEEVRAMLDNSDLVVGVVEGPDTRDTSGELRAFARVLSDRVFKALVFDVIVEPGYRDQGLGKLLMERVLNHPSLATVKHVELYCLPEMVPFYEKWSFTSELGSLRFLRRSGPES